MTKKMFSLLLASLLLSSLSILAFAQQASEREGKKQASAQGKDRWEGIVVRSDKDKSTLTVRKRGSSEERTVVYDSSTKFASQEHGKKATPIDASQIKDGDRVIALGTLDKNGVLHATLISKRLTG